MAIIAAAPLVLKDSVFAVAADQYQAHVSTVEFVPAAGTVNWKGLTPTAVFTGVTSATWTCNLSFAQDWSTTNSLSKYLFDNEGKTVVVKFLPQTVTTGTTPTWTATVYVTPGSIGGAVDSVAVASVTLAVVGKPVLTTAAVPA